MTLVALILQRVTLTVAPVPLPSAGANSGDAIMEDAPQTPVSTPRSSGVPAPKRTPVRRHGRDQRGGRSKEMVTFCMSV